MTTIKTSAHIDKSEVGVALKNAAKSHSLDSSSSRPASSQLEQGAVLVPAKIITDKPIANSSISRAQVDKPQPAAANPSQVTLDIKGKQIQFKPSLQVNQLLQAGAKVMISAEQVTQLTTSTQPSPTQAVNLGQQQIVIVGQPVRLNLPDEILNIAYSNGISSKQLLTLASRPQGYPLPIVNINTNVMRFDNGTNVTVSTLPTLPSGTQVAYVSQIAGKLQLILSPVRLIESVPMTLKVDHITDASTKAAPSLTSQLEQRIITRNEPVQVLSQFLKKLEHMPAAIENSHTRPVQSNTTTYPVQNPATELIAKQSHQEQALFIKIKDVLTSPFNNRSIDLLNSNVSQLLSKGASLSPDQFKQLTNLILQMAQSSNAGSLRVTQDQIAAITTQVNKLTPQAKLDAAHISAATKLTGETVANTVSNNTVAGNSLVSHSKSPFEVLNQNLSKAGAMPSQQADTTQSQSLASQLLKILPKLDPSPITELVNPQLLKAELTQLANLNLSQTASIPNSALMGGAITSLFQLLLGFKLKSVNTSMSPKLQNYMAKLQQKVISSMTANHPMLAALDKAGSLESLTKFASSVNLYQQASNENSQTQTWYFALPYSIGQRNEQFEGKFEQSTAKDEDEKQQGWRLQLKFNLAHGPLLINAHKQGKYLDLAFTGDNPAILSKVDSFQEALAEKINQAGLQAREIKTTVAPVAATLLPGDHYLVKTNA
ncbi:Flagellar hook-length control protein FliK [Shewanella sp. P1-14-1]|uniref:flagellar hook-length control protein FliK n=1 Tax=Shewanella sp. P1-14-1 TaxID=1723761 RepID=UPI0006D6559F|nr:flagellar hook-length control protein FliK [Shewanella sp. P1-14-1]KPZ69880.1 Flagellar hook-length control protein FliK [Shewanella sp. P1-14-1]